MHTSLILFYSILMYNVYITTDSHPGVRLRISWLLWEMDSLKSVVMFFIMFSILLYHTGCCGEMLHDQFTQS